MENRNSKRKIIFSKLGESPQNPPYVHFRSFWADHELALCEQECSRWENKYMLRCTDNICTCSHKDIPDDIATPH